MNEVEIFRGVDSLVKIKPESNSVQAKRVMAENELRLVFNLSYYVNFKLNDHCTVFFEKYKINKLPIVTKVSTYLYEYQMVMEAEGFDLAKVQYLFLGSANTLTQGTFTLMGTADTFMDLLIANGERVGAEWIKGQVIPTGYKNITFTAENCYNALAHIAQEFGTEFAIEGKKLHLTQRSADTGITLRHGRFRGLYEITRQNVDNSSIITRLYAFGSSKNLPATYRDTRLKMPLVDYLELNVGEYGVIEGSHVFEDVYPHRTGKVTSVNVSDVFKFYDTSIDFNVMDQLMPGVSAKVVFNTGDLAGYTFEIGKYDHALNEFTLLKNKDEKVLDLPSADFRASIGDTYVLVDIFMPQSYVDAAELDLKNKCIEMLANVSEPQVQYSLVPDPVYLSRKKITVDIGDLVWLYDQQLEIKRQIRITSTLRNIINEFEYTVELSDVLTKSPITLLQNATNTQGRELGVINQQINVLSENNLGALPTITSPAGHSPVYINNTTGKLYRLV